MSGPAHPALDAVERLAALAREGPASPRPEAVAAWLRARDALVDRLRGAGPLPPELRARAAAAAAEARLHDAAAIERARGDRDAVAGALARLGEAARAGAARAGAARAARARPRLVSRRA